MRLLLSTDEADYDDYRALALDGAGVGNIEITIELTKHGLSSSGITDYVKCIVDLLLAWTPNLVNPESPYFRYMFFPHLPDEGLWTFTKVQLLHLACCWSHIASSGCSAARLDLEKTERLPECQDRCQIACQKKMSILDARKNVR